MPRNTAKLKLTAAVIAGAVTLGAGLSACHRTESTATLLAEAKKYQDQGDQNAALIQLKNAVAQSPEDSEARLQLGTLYLDMGDVVSADKELRKSESLGLAHARVLPLLARTMLLRGQFKELLDALPADQAARSAPLLVLRGDALLASGDAAKAKDAYDQALALDPKLGDALIGLARLAMAGKDSDAAARYVADAAAADPKNAEVWMFKGQLLRAQNKPQEALAAFGEALAVKPRHRTAHIERAFVEIGAGKFADARTDLEAAQKVTPGNLTVTYAQALLDFSQANYPAARESLQKVLRAAPEHMQSILLAGAVELNLGANQQAEQHLRKYLESNPDNLYARKLLAQSLLKGASAADAVAVLAPALKDPPQDPQLLALAGESYLRARDFNKAEAYFEKASTLSPKAASIRTALGLSKLGQGDQAGAVTDLEAAAALDPKSTDAGFALVRAEMGLKHYDKALAAAQALEKQQPGSAQVQTVKGAVYAARGDMASARAAWDKAVELDPTFFVAVSNLARLDLQDKKPDAAKKRFQAVLAKDAKNVPAMTALAEIEMSQGHADQATGWLEKASNDNPDAIAPALALGNHYLNTKQAPKALALARKFQTANADNPDLLNLLGQAQLAGNDTSGALESYSKLVNVLPKSPLAQVRLAAVHMLQKNNDAAADDLKRALALDPAYVPAYLAQVEMAMRQSKPDDALAAARRLQKQAPQSPAGFMLEGDLHQLQKHPELALAPYEKAWNLNKSTETLLKITQLLKKTGKAAEAEARLAQLQKERPADPLLAMAATDELLAKKQYKPAIDRLQGVLKQNPGNAVALNNLAWAYQQQNDPRALETAEQAYKLAGDTPAVLDTLGWILVQRGDVTRGLPILRKASGTAPQAQDIRYHLGAALARSGDKAGAKKELEQCLAAGTAFASVDDAKSLLKQL